MILVTDRGSEYSLSNMWKFLLVALFLGTASVGYWLHPANAVPNETAEPETVLVLKFETRIDGYTWSDMQAVQFGKYCRGVDRNSDWRVYIDIVEQDDIQGYAGQWIYSSSTDIRTVKLVLDRGTNIGTIAHEVHHMVDDMMVHIGIEDDHYEAYAQGYWTRCVYDSVVEQLS